MFYGRYDFTIDPKGRLNFPAKFRDAMGPGSFVVLEWVDGCLFCLSEEEVEKLMSRMGSESMMDSWEATGDLFSTADAVEPDRQGRILLSARLREYAKLDKNVTLIGNRNHVEIWNTAVWDARHGAVTNEQRVARLRALNI
jgi:MraZ protein